MLRLSVEGTSSALTLGLAFKNTSSLGYSGPTVTNVFIVHILVLDKSEIDSIFGSMDITLPYYSYVPVCILCTFYM